MSSAYFVIRKGAEKAGFLPLEVEASNGVYAGRADAYIFPDEFRYFAKQLAGFPRYEGDEAVFSFGGDDEQSYAYLYLRAIRLEPDNQTALEVRMRHDGPQLEAGRAAFVIAAPQARLNALGQALVNWVDQPELPLRFEF